MTCFHPCLYRKKGVQKTVSRGKSDNDTSIECESFKLTPSSSHQVSSDVRTKELVNPASISEMEHHLRCTVRVHIKDVTKSKDDYTLYFEDDPFSSFSFDEKTMILDGLNQCIYVTFSKEEGKK